MNHARIKVVPQCPSPTSVIHDSSVHHRPKIQKKTIACWLRMCQSNAAHDYDEGHHAVKVGSVEAVQTWWYVSFSRKEIGQHAGLTMTDRLWRVRGYGGDIIGFHYCWR